MHSSEPPTDESTKPVKGIGLVHLRDSRENHPEDTIKHTESRYIKTKIRSLKHDYDYVIRLVCRQCDKQHYRSKGVPKATVCEGCGATPMHYKCSECLKFSPSYSAAKNHLIYHCMPYDKYECLSCDYVAHSKKNMLKHLSYNKKVRGPARKWRESVNDVAAAPVEKAPNHLEKENFRLTGLDQSLFSARSRQVSMHEMSYLAPYIKVDCLNECSDQRLVYHYDHDKCCKSCDSEYTFSCLICDKGSKNDKVTGSHIKVKHLLTNLQRTIKCDFCPSKFLFNEDLKSHIRLTHRKATKFNIKVSMAYGLF